MLHKLAGLSRGPRNIRILVDHYHVSQTFCSDDNIQFEQRLTSSLSVVGTNLFIREKYNPRKGAHA